MTPRPCPDAQRLRLLLEDRSQGPDAEAVEAHVENCPDCQQALEGLTAGAGPRAGLPETVPAFLRRLEGDPPTGAWPEPARDDPAAAEPSVVTGYEILEELGRGGMGVVYKARQVKADRVVALKMILTGGHAGKPDLARFRTEAEAVARLDHPNIVPIYEVGETGGRPFFTMKWIDGTSLAQYLPRLAQDERAAAGLVAAVARAVHHAHQRGVIHRDLKPANVLLAADGTPYVTDFGLAKRTDGDSGQTQSGVIVGTPSYMAPEQASGQKGITTAVDVYALGAILYECLTGAPPFLADTPLTTLLLLTEHDPAPPRALNPRVSADLELICLKCLNKDPQQRYGSAEALAADLEHWLAGEPLSVRPPSLASLLRLWLRQNFGAAGWAVVIGLAEGVLAGLMCWVVLIQPALSQSAAAYAHFPGIPRPWLGMAWDLPQWVRTALYVSTLLAASAVGLVNALLVRPRNRGADVAAGVVTGLIAAVTAFTLSYGWLMVAVTSVLPAEADLRATSEAAASGNPDAVLERYPELREVPAQERGALLYHKIRADLLTGIPGGIWLGMLALIAAFLLGNTCETMAAGPLLRRHGLLGRVLPPYAEIAAPLSILIWLNFGALFSIYVGGYREPRVWHVAMVVFLALAVTGVLRGWHWAVRLALQIGWVSSLVVVAVLKAKGI